MRSYSWAVILGLNLNTISYYLYIATLRYVFVSRKDAKAQNADF